MSTSHHATAWAWDQEIFRSASEKFVLLALASATGGDEDDPRVCWPSIARIAKQTGIGESTVRLHMERLAARGLISKVERRVRRDGTLGTWKLTVNFTSADPSAVDDYTTADTSAVVHSRPIGALEPAISEPAIKKMRDESFEEFWRGYPKARRISKPAALKAWRQIAAKDHLLVMLALSAWVKFWETSRTEDHWIPYPQKWLNQQHWENPPEPEPVPVVVIRPCIMCAAPNPREECNGPNYIGPDFDMAECPWRR